MANQSNTQQMIQSLLGAQTQGQAVSGQQANNGNPGTIYNQPVVGGEPGQLPIVPGAPAQPGTGTSQFGAWIASPGTVLAPGAPIDPYGAIRQTGLQSQPNSTLDDILNRIRSGNFGITPNPSAPGPGTGGPPGGTPQPPGTPGYTPPGGVSGPDQIGPISGPIANDPHNWQFNFNNAQPGTGPRPGSGYNSLPWRQGTGPSLIFNQDPQTRTNTIGGFLENLAGSDSNGNTLGQWLGNLRQQAADAIRRGIGNTGAWQQIADILSEPWAPGDWYNSETGEWNDPATAMGLSQALAQVTSGGQGQNGQPADFSWANPADNGIGTILSNIFDNVDARRGLEEHFGDTQRAMQEYYNSHSEMSPSEFQSMLNRLNRTAEWNTMWDEGRAGDIGQELGRQAESWTRQMIESRGRLER